MNKVPVSSCPLLLDPPLFMIMKKHKLLAKMILVYTKFEIIFHTLSNCYHSSIFIIKIVVDLTIIAKF